MLKKEVVVHLIAFGHFELHCKNIDISLSTAVIADWQLFA